jgi:hypothetical protein
VSTGVVLGDESEVMEDEISGKSSRSVKEVSIRGKETCARFATEPEGSDRQGDKALPDQISASEYLISSFGYAAIAPEERSFTDSVLGYMSICSSSSSKFMDADP